MLPANAKTGADDAHRLKANYSTTHGIQATTSEARTPMTYSVTMPAMSRADKPQLKIDGLNI